MSKKNVVFVALAVKDPGTKMFEVIVVSETFKVVTFARVATTFVVVRELETTRLTNGWTIEFELIFERRPPSAVMVPGNIAAPVDSKSQV